MPEITGSREALALAVFEQIVAAEKQIRAFNGTDEYVDLLADILLAIDNPTGRSGRAGP